MHWGITRAFFIFTIISIVFFLTFSQIDILVSSLFYTKAEGFYLSKNPIILFIYSIPRMIVILAILALIVLIIDVAFKRKLLNIRPLLIFYFVSVMAIGPGIIVHNVLKDNWGRARPAKIVEFGGVKEFTPAWVLSDQCHKNCSFVSGHSGGAFGLIALALLVKKRRKTALLSAIVLGSIVGLGRIIQGGHFLSDIFFSFIIVYLTAKILYYFIFEKELFNFIDKRCTS